MKTFKTLQYNIFGVNSNNRMFYSIHNFISTLFHLICVIKSLVTFSLALTLKVRMLDITKLLRNADQKNKN